MLDLREEVVKMKDEVREIETKQESFAMEFVHTLKAQNKRMFICWLVTFIAFIGLLGYTIWLYNDIEAITKEIDIEDVNTIDESNIKIGDDIWEESK